eukprot:COSAG01_NODE_3505_length_5993_cov_5.816763_3_plen_95_part_00
MERHESDVQALQCTNTISGIKRSRDQRWFEAIQVEDSGTQLAREQRTHASIVSHWHIVEVIPDAVFQGNKNGDERAERTLAFSEFCCAVLGKRF